MLGAAFSSCSSCLFCRLVMAALSGGAVEEPRAGDPSGAGLDGSTSTALANDDALLERDRWLSGEIRAEVLFGEESMAMGAVTLGPK